jgi:hypothetical protein
MALPLAHKQLVERVAELERKIAALEQILSTLQARKPGRPKKAPE